MASEEPPAPEEGQPREKLRSPATALATGFVAGMFTALFGVGGGFLSVPALVTLLGIRQSRAVGTSLAAMLPAAIAALLTYTEAGSLRLEIWPVLELAIGSVLGAALGGALARAVTAVRFRTAFGVAIVVAGMGMVVMTGRASAGGTPAAAAPGILFALGVAAGLLSGLMSVSAGLFIVPALGLALGYPERLAQATSLAVVIPVSLPGALAHARRGNVIAALVGWLAIGGVIGVEVTGWWVQRLPDALLRGAFGALLIAVGVSMVAGRHAARGAPASHA